MIQGLHRQLKAALMCHADEHWAEVLPMVLLGIRNAKKEDVIAASVELVYGSPLRIPGNSSSLPP
jgi:hypothetical protein